MIGHTTRLFSLVCILVGVSLLPPSTVGATATTDGGTPVPVSADTADLEGTILLPPRQDDRRRYRGRAYRQRTNRGTQNPRSADQSEPKNRYRNVIISAHPVSADPAVLPLEEPAEIDQANASFVPQVTAVTAGSRVEFINSDPFYHNVFSLTPGARFNIGRRPTGVVVPETIPFLDEPVPGLGVVELHCDIHPQMNAFIVSLDTPYFTRAHADGTYLLEDLPPGEYRIRAFMPRQDIVSFTIELGKGERASRRIDLR